MDPYGFVLEPFDGIGAARTTDNGAPINPSATLADGTTLSGYADLNTQLATDTRVSACMTQQLLIYALGRGLAPSDDATLTSLQQGFEADSQRVDHLLESIAMSPEFRTRGGASLP